jgi:hypothetical protein
MKSTGIINTTALFLLLGVATPAIASQEKPEKQEEKAKPAQKEQPAKPEQRQEEAKAPKQEPAKPEKQQEAKAPKQQPSAKPEKQQQANAPKPAQSKPQKQQQAAAPKQEQATPGKQQQPRQQQAKYAPPQRSQQEISRQRAQPAIRLSARTNVRIPDDRFRSNFGSDHHFRIGNPVLVGGYSRFQYGGFWFGFVQPWPSGWYYTDDVYIDYVDGGYYMFNPYYPGVRFSISVVS